MTIQSTIGRFRLYFNRHGAAPLLWCVSPVDAAWEIAVASVTIHTRCWTVYRPKETADEDDGRPSAWIECEGQLLIQSSRATIGDPQ